MKRITLAACVAFSFVLASCGGGEATNSDTTAPAADSGAQAAQPTAPQQQTQPAGAWRNFSSNEFEVQYPGDWTLNANSQYNAAFELYAPSTANDGFAENINLIRQSLQGQSLPLQDYASLSLGQIEKAVANSNVLASGIYNNAGTDYFEIVYTGGLGNMQLKWKQHFFVQDTTAWVLTYSAQQNSFDQFNTQATAIMGSFRLKGGQ